MEPQNPDCSLANISENKAIFYSLWGLAGTCGPRGSTYSAKIWGRIAMRIAVLTILAALGAWGLLRAQKPFREYPGAEYENFPLPDDWGQKTEWTRARLKVHGINRGWRRSDLNWTIDYPRSDRHLLQGIRRLTRIDTRSVEQVVEPDGGDDIYNWPSLYAVEVGHWLIDPDQARQLREFLLRGGFLMVDDFHGTREWETFLEGIKKIFPDRPIVDLDPKETIFHTIFDLDDKFQVPGAQYLRSGRTYEQDGYEPHWRGIFDDKGRVMVAICHDMDLGDAWEWSDDPRYDEKFAGLAYRIAVNYWVYDLTH